MPMVATVFIRTRRTPSSRIRARDTPNDGAANGSTGVNSAPDVDAGVNSAPDLGGQHCGDHEDRGDSTNYRNLAEHDLRLPWAQNNIGPGISGQGPQGRYSSSTDASNTAAGLALPHGPAIGDIVDVLEAWEGAN
jgi:hypothetical protein